MTGPIAVTGITGFIGRRVAALAAERGLSIRALVRRPHRLDARAREAIEVVEGDVLDPEAVSRLTRGAAAVIHCAGALMATGRTLASVNVEGTSRLAEAARQAGVSRFVHVSSVAARQPGVSAYASSKRQGEDALKAALAEQTYVIVRPPAVYGPGDKSTFPLVAQLVRQTAWLPGSRAQRFSLIYVDDLARALLDLARMEEPTGSAHELHDGRLDGYSWAELAATAREVQGRPVAVHFLPQAALAGVARVAATWTLLTGHVPKPRLNPDKVRELYHPDWVCRNNLLDQACGWRPLVPFARGFARTVEWYRQSGWLPPAPGMAMTGAGADHGEPAE